MGMNVATNRERVGIRELKNGLSKYIDHVRAGGEIIVTDHGHPVARLSALDEGDTALARLIHGGIVRPPSSDDRHVPRRRVKPSAVVSELVAEQRRR